MKKLFLILSFVFLSLPIYCQYTDSLFYYAGFSSTGTFNKTQDNNSYLVNNSLKFGMRKKTITINSTNKWLYGEQNKELTNRDISSSWDVNLYKTFPHFYYWGLLNYNSIYSLKINKQLQEGIGVAYNVIDRKTLVVNISDGIIYDYSDLTINDSVRDVYGTPRNSLRVQVKWNIKDRLTFNGNSFLQNSLQYSGDYIIKTDLSLSIKVKKWLSLTSTLTYNKMARTNAENLLITYGFTIENYF